MGSPPAAARRQPTAALAPSFLTRTAAQTQSPAQPPPRCRPTSGPRARDCLEPQPGPCGVTAGGEPGRYLRKKPGPPRSKRLAASSGAVVVTAGGCLAALRPGANGVPVPQPPPPPELLAPPTPRSAGCARAWLPGDRHCQVEPRPLRA